MSNICIEYHRLQGRTQDFLEGGRIFKQFSKNWSTFSEKFSGRPYWFSEPSQIAKKTLFLPIFLGRKIWKEKLAKKFFLDTFWQSTSAGESGSWFHIFQTVVMWFWAYYWASPLPLSNPPSTREWRGVAQLMLF